MDTTQLRTILEELHFSAELPADVLDHLARASSTQHFAIGSVVFREAMPSDNFYLVLAGNLALDMNVPGRGAVRILTLGAGDMVGWSALLGYGKMTASLVVVEDAELVVAPAAKLRELIESNHEFGFHLMKRMAEALSKRLTATRLQMLDLFADTPAIASAATMEGEG